jgi:hypothetical protein
MHHGNSIRLLAGLLDLYLLWASIENLLSIGNSHPELAQAVAERYAVAYTAHPGLIYVDSCQTFCGSHHADLTYLYCPVPSKNSPMAKST